MKEGWITPNVKRAYEMQARPHYFDGPHPDAVHLQFALDLLHFAAELANVPVRISWAPVFSATREEPGPTVKREVGYQVANGFPEYDGPEFFFGAGNSESLLHAILLAIDSIVAHKPEAFA